MTFEEKLNSYSYFDNNIYTPSLTIYGSTGSTAIYNALVSATGSSANLLSINEDYFLSYFTRESIDGLPIPRDFKYSIFSYGDSIKFSETLFRGSKVTIKDRSEFTPINYNVESLRFLANPIYNGYKYSAVLTYGISGTQITCIKNDKWKTLTTLIQANIEDLALSRYTKFINTLSYKWGTSPVTSGRISSLGGSLGNLPTFIYINKFDASTIDKSSILNELEINSILRIQVGFNEAKYKITSINLVGDIYEFGVQFLSGSTFSPMVNANTSVSLYEAPSNFIDRSLLYTLQNSLQIDPSTEDLVISDTTVSGSIYDFTNIIGQDYFTVYAGADANGNLPNFINDFIYNANGGYNEVTVGDYTYSFAFTFKGIYDVTSTSFKCKFIDTDLPSNSGITTLVPGTGNGWSELKSYLWNSIPQQALWPVWDGILSSTIFYDQGGYNAYQIILDDITFAKISDRINGGDPEIRYINVTSNGDVEFDKFCLEIVRPDTPIKSSYIKSIPLRDKPVDLQTAVRILGYEMINEDRLSINQITRYRGGYNPRWRDIFKFIDTDEIKGYGLDYNNIQILTELPHITDSSIGYIKNAYFNKVNVENPNVILRSSTATKNKNIFPLVGEIAIDYSDYFTFRSNWDPFYFKRYIKSEKYENVIGTREPKEEKSFFGSKVISIPNSVNLETFPQGIINSDELFSKNQVFKISENIVRSEKRTKAGRILNLDVYTDLALADFLITNGFSDEFTKYINPEYSFGDPILDDDIRAYILDNIRQRYVVKNIIFWEKYWNAGDPYPEIQTGMTDSQKLSNGYFTSRSFNTIFENPDDLNFKLIYNIPQDKNFSIAFTVILEKK